MGLLDDLLGTVPQGDVLDVRIGLHWTAVVAEVNGQRRCGLASSLHEIGDHGDEPDVPQAGQLQARSGLELAALLRGNPPLLRSVAGAAINALLPLPAGRLEDANAAELIARLGSGKPVAIVGRFPFAARLEARVDRLWVLERDPKPGELPEGAAEQVIPQAAVVAITAMTLLNHSLERLLKLCAPQARVLLIGPTTPLSPIFFDYGVDILSGSLVTDIDAVLAGVSQGANFRQIHRAGVRLVNLAAPGVSEHWTDLG